MKSQEKRGRRILIVDDVPANTTMLRVLAEKKGYTVAEARHGAEALVIARQTLPDLIISDLLMPVMDGYTLLRQWKTDEQLKKIPFVIYTATYTDPKDEQLALNMGADAFIIKPCEPNQFIARIEEILVATRGNRIPTTELQSEDESIVLKEYNEALIRKLEDKLIELEAEMSVRQHAESALYESERRFREMLENMQLVAVVLDTGGRVTFCNAFLLRITGYTADEVLGSNWFTKFVPDVHADVKEVFVRGLHRGEIDARYENPIRTKEGKERFIRFSNTIMRNAQGAIIGITSIGEDITERKRAESKLAYQASLLENVNDAVIASDVNYCITSWNKAAEEIYGWKADEVIGRREGEFLHTEFITDTQPEVSRMLSENGRYRGVWRQHCKDGRQLYIETTVIILHDSEGKKTGFVGVNRDITERKQIEEKNYAQVEELQRWFQSTLGREERINELKREVNNLLLQSGKSIKYTSQDKV